MPRLDFGYTPSPVSVPYQVIADTLDVSGISTLIDTGITGALTIHKINADALVLGGATEEGGDISVYGNNVGARFFHVDADGESGSIITLNANSAATKAINIVDGHIFLSGNKKVTFRDQNLYIYSSADGIMDVVSDTQINLNSQYIYVNEQIRHQGDPNTYISFDTDDIRIYSGGVKMVQATGTNLGFFNTSQTQQAHIADPTDLATCITVLTTLLADLEGYGLLAAA